MIRLARDCPMVFFQRSHGSTFHWSSRVYRFSCTQLWERYNSKSMPRWCWKTRQKSWKIIKLMRSGQDDQASLVFSTVLGPYPASDTQTVIAPSSISQDRGPIRECLQEIRQRLETHEIWLDLSKKVCHFSHSASTEESQHISVSELLNHLASFWNLWILKPGLAGMIQTVVLLRLSIELTCIQRVMCVMQIRCNHK